MSGSRSRPGHSCPLRPQAHRHPSPHPLAQWGQAGQDITLQHAITPYRAMVGKQASSSQACIPQMARACLCSLMWSLVWGLAQPPWPPPSPPVQLLGHSRQEGPVPQPHHAAALSGTCCCLHCGGGPHRLGACLMPLLPLKRLCPTAATAAASMIGPLRQEFSDRTLLSQPLPLACGATSSHQPSAAVNAHQHTCHL